MRQRARPRRSRSTGSPSRAPRPRSRPTCATALAPALGESLLGLDLNELTRRAEQVPMVASASFDRAFPHTLEIAVVPEVPVAVLRQGSSSWLAAAGGRVVAELDKGERPGLPRVWLKRDVDVRVGESLRGPQRRAVAAVAPLVEEPLPSAVNSVVARAGRPDARAPLRDRATARRLVGSPGQARGRAPRAAAARRRARLPRRQRSRAPGGGRKPQLSGRGRDYNLDHPLSFGLTVPTRRRTLDAEKNVRTRMLYSSFRSREIETLLR